MTEDIEWFVGFDWASQIHVACLLDRNGRVVGERELKHAGAELAEFCDWLIAKTAAPPARIGVAIETPTGRSWKCCSGPPRAKRSRVARARREPVPARADDA